MFLLLAIGLKGGVALSKTELGFVVWPAAGTLGLGVVTLLIGVRGAYLARKARSGESCRDRAE